MVSFEILIVVYLQLSKQVCLILQLALLDKSQLFSLSGNALKGDLGFGLSTLRKLFICKKPNCGTFLKVAVVSDGLSQVDASQHSPSCVCY